MYDIDANETTHANNVAPPNWWTWPEARDLPEERQPRVHFRNPTGAERRKWDRVRTRMMDRMRAYNEAQKDVPEEERDPFLLNEDEIEAYVDIALSCVTRLVRIGRDGTPFDWSDGASLVEMIPDAENEREARAHILLSFGPVPRRVANFLNLCNHITVGLREPQKKDLSDTSMPSSGTQITPETTSAGADAPSAGEASTPVAQSG